MCCIRVKGTVSTKRRIKKIVGSGHCGGSASISTPESSQSEVGIPQSPNLQRSLIHICIWIKERAELTFYGREDADFPSGCYSSIRQKFCGKADSVRLRF